MCGSLIELVYFAYTDCLFFSHKEWIGIVYFYDQIILKVSNHEIWGPLALGTICLEV